MGDVLKLAKDKRHRSSSSLAGVLLEGTRSERKLDLNGSVSATDNNVDHFASIPEAEDQFAGAEARCDDLQEKIDLIKVLKRKRKLKKRSMTRVSDQPAVPEPVPFITVRTQPKKKVSQQAARLRRVEVPPNPARGYLDPAMVEQHRMIGQVRGYQQQQPEHSANRPSTQEHRPYPRTRTRRSHAEGDSMSSQGVQITTAMPQQNVSAQADAVGIGSSERPNYECSGEYSGMTSKKADQRGQARPPPIRRRHVPRDVPAKQQERLSGNAYISQHAAKSRTDFKVNNHRNNSVNPFATAAPTPKWGEDSTEEAEAWRGAPDRVQSPVTRRRMPQVWNYQNAAPVPQHKEERPVVELFNKNRTGLSPENRRQAPLHTSAPVDKKNKKVREPQRYDDEATGPLEDVSVAPSKKDGPRHPRRVRYRSRRYELPTVASQMKQAGMRCYYGNANHTNIPFVVSKSTAPSHNIGVNIQQVLNGIKIQQPLSGIPLTIAHHMGLGHVPTYGTKSATAQPSLDNREINVIKVGQKLLRLPSYKYMSYNRLLNLYREGDGMVPRFLRAISRPHYFYTSMYNLATNRDDFDGATSKGRGGSQEAKQSLAEYASLYREYEHIDKCIRDGNYEPELERRKEELARELAAREEHIRRVMQDYRASGEAEQPVLRASASTAEDGYRHSTFKLNLSEPQH